MTANYGDIADGSTYQPVISTYEKLEGGLNNCTVKDAILVTLANGELRNPVSIGTCIK